MFILHLLYGQQTAIYTYICAILPRVQPYVATDLYIGTVRRRPVAIAPSVADAGGEDERLAS